MANASSKLKAQQDFGTDPVEMRDTDHYQEEYVHRFVDKWDELIDWDARYASEGVAEKKYLAGEDDTLNVSEKTNLNKGDV